MIAIIDYDAGNIKSVEKALHYLGEETVVSRDPLHPVLFSVHTDYSVYVVQYPESFLLPSFLLYLALL